MPETPAAPEPSAPWEYALHIPNDPRAVTISRRTLRLILTMHGLIRIVDTAELLAAELVSNAVRHTEGPAALRVRWAAGVLRIGAWDADPRPPEPPGSFGLLPDAEDGRGLALVMACAAEWGWQPLTREGRQGKYVWCELGVADVSRVTGYRTGSLEIGRGNASVRMMSRELEKMIGSYRPGHGTAIDEAYLKGWAEGWAKGWAKGAAKGVLRVLEVRGLSISAAVRERIAGCEDPDLVADWLDRAGTVERTEELFGEVASLG